MKYFLLTIFLLINLICSSQNNHLTDSINRELNLIKLSIDSLRNLQRRYEKTLDSIKIVNFDSKDKYILKWEWKDLKAGEKVFISKVDDKWTYVNTFKYENYKVPTYFLELVNEIEESEKLRKKEISEELQKNKIYNLIINRNDLDLNTKVLKSPNNLSIILQNFNLDSIQILDYVNDYFLIKSKNGNVGYIKKYSINEYNKYAKRVREKNIENIKSEKNSFQIKNVWVRNINSANGVDIVVEWGFFNPKKTIKYIYFYLVPYNSVGDIQFCSITRTSEKICKITGPISSKFEFNNSYWDATWYNNTISCIRVKKVVIEYMDNSKSIYINDLPQILNKNFKNLCN